MPQLAFIGMLLAGVFFATPLIAAERSATHFVIAAGATTPEVSMRIAELVDQTVATLQPGDKLTVFSLAEQQTLGQIALPGNRRVNARALESRYGEERDAIRRTLINLPGRNGEPSRWPQGLAAIGKLIDPGIADRIVNVMVVDAVLYHDNAEPRVSMRTAYPNTALIRASQAMSPFGVAERRGQMSGVNVHFCHREEPRDFVNDQHQRLVESAVATFVTEQGGTLATFTNAWAICRSRFLEATKTGLITPAPTDSSEAPAMLIIAPRKAEAAPAPTPAAPLEEPVSRPPAVAMAPVTPPDLTVPAPLPHARVPEPPLGPTMSEALPTAPLVSEIPPVNVPMAAPVPVVPPALLPPSEPEMQPMRPPLVSETMPNPPAPAIAAANPTATSKAAPRKIRKTKKRVARKYQRPPRYTAPAPSDEGVTIYCGGCGRTRWVINGQVNTF